MSSNIESQKWWCIGLESAAWISWTVASISSRPSVRSVASELALGLGKEAAKCFLKLVSENRPSKLRQLESAKEKPSQWIWSSDREGRI